MRIINIQGKVLIKTQKADYEKIDVSHLTKGNYFVLKGYIEKEIKSFLFIK